MGVVGIADRASVNNVVLYGQPIYNAESDELVSIEVLMRYRGLEGNGAYEVVKNLVGIADEIKPNLRTAERFRLLDIHIIKETTDWVIGASIGSKFRVNVNISKHTICSKDTVENIVSMITKRGLQDIIVLEINEDTDMLCAEALGNIKSIQDNKIEISIDDFNKSGINFDRLLGISPSEMKYSHTGRNDFSKRDLSKISTISKRLKQLGIRFIVEGIETDSQYMAIKQIGALNIQGYSVGKPRDLQSFRNFGH